MKTQAIFLASRPKTLVAIISPIVLGTVYSIKMHTFHVWIFSLTLIFGLLIQIATNFANDYFDGIKGSDTKNRKGPFRMTQSGLISSQKMLFLIFSTLITAVATSLPLIIRGGTWITILMPICIFFSIFYTAGRYAISYIGLGEFFVLFFFGPIATGITSYLQSLVFDWKAFAIGLGPGFISTAILVVNYLRDFDEDYISNKKTMAVRFGKTFAKYEYLFCISMSLLIPPIVIQKWFVWILWIPFIHLFKFLIQEKELNWILQKTGLILFLYTLLFFL